MKSTQWLATMGIVVAGVIAAFLVMRQQGPEADTHGHNEKQAAHSDEPSGKGPHGGRMLAEGPFSVEVTIFETGVPPEFRVYAYESGKPIDPASVKLAIELTRLGAKPELVNFKPQEGYLRGDREIEEPHSFDVALVAERGGKTYRWEYEQAEGRVTMDDATAANSGIEIATAGPGDHRLDARTAGRDPVRSGPCRPCHPAPLGRGREIGQEPRRHSEEGRSARRHREPGARRSQERVPRGANAPAARPVHVRSREAIVGGQDLGAAGLSRQPDGAGRG